MTSISEEQARYLSFHDPVTGLYNRAYLEEEMRRMDNERFLPLSIIMGDIGGLRSITDRFGSATAAQVLRRTASILKISSRQSDIIARWNGERFVLLLPNTGPEEADRVRLRIEAECRKAADLPQPPGIALGVSSKTNSEQNMYRVLQEAEERMLVMKRYASVAG